MRLVFDLECQAWRALACASTDLGHKRQRMTLFCEQMRVSMTCDPNLGEIAPRSPPLAAQYGVVLCSYLTTYFALDPASLRSFRYDGVPD